MIWKTSIVLSLASCVLTLPRDRPPAVSDQKVETHVNGHHVDMVHIGHHKPEHHEGYARTYPSYEFLYNVEDPHTHDIKQQHEERDGGDVTGNYWLIQPDGKKRYIRYHVDDESGFTAVINYTSPHSSVYYNMMKHREDTGSKKVDTEKEKGIEAHHSVSSKDGEEKQENGKQEKNKGEQSRSLKPNDERKNNKHNDNEQVKLNKKDRDENDENQRNDRRDNNNERRDNKQKERHSSHKKDSENTKHGSRPVNHDEGRDDHREDHHNNRRDDYRNNRRDGNNDNRHNVHNDNHRDDHNDNSRDNHRGNHHDGRNDNRHDDHNDNRRDGPNDNRRDDHNDNRDNLRDDHHDHRRDNYHGNVRNSGYGIGHFDDSKKNQDSHRGHGKQNENSHEDFDLWAGLKDWTITHDRSKSHEKPVWEWNFDQDHSWPGPHSWSDKRENGKFDKKTREGNEEIKDDKQTSGEENRDVSEGDNRKDNKQNKKIGQGRRDESKNHQKNNANSRGSYENRWRDGEQRRRDDRGQPRNKHHQDGNNRGHDDRVSQPSHVHFTPIAYAQRY